MWTVVSRSPRAGGADRRLSMRTARTGFVARRRPSRSTTWACPSVRGVHGARRHDVRAARDLLDELLPNHPRAADVRGDRELRGLTGPIAREHGVNVEIEHRDRLPCECLPVKPLHRAEDVFAQLGRWRRLARSFEATPASATAWVQFACVGWVLTMLCRRAAPSCDALVSRSRASTGVSRQRSIAWLVNDSPTPGGTERPPRTNHGTRLRSSSSRSSLPSAKSASCTGCSRRRARCTTPGCRNAATPTGSPARPSPCASSSTRSPAPARSARRCSSSGSSRYVAACAGWMRRWQRSSGVPKQARHPATRGSRAGAGSTPRCGTNPPAGRPASANGCSTSRVSVTSGCRSPHCGSSGGSSDAVARCARSLSPAARRAPATCGVPPSGSATSRSRRPSRQPVRAAWSAATTA